MHGTLDSRLKTFNTMPDNAKSARKAAATKKRGMLSARAWEDLRQASRLAHAQGVTLFMHGVKIVPQERYVSKGDTTPSKPRAAATTLTTTERDGRKRQPTVPVGDARDQPSKRQQRSAQRLQDHREKQRAATVHARVHARWLSIVHRRWLHAVWTEHRLALSMQDTTTNECGANCAVNRHPTSPPKGGGKKSRGGNSSRPSKKPGIRLRTYLRAIYAL